MVGCEVYGHFDIPCGLQISARNAVEQLVGKGWEVRLHSVKHGEVSIRPAQSLSHADVNLFHVNPGEFWNYLAWPHEDPRFEDRLNVCVPYWELPRLPEFWIPVLRTMDVILAPTTFIADAIRAALPEATIVNYPQAVSIPADIRRDRVRFGLPDDAFIFGTSFSAEAVMERKNPWAAIQAFKTAFPDDPDVRLVVRASPGSTFPATRVWRDLRDFAADERVLVLEGHLDYAGILSLYASLDAYISLHRAEGLGLGMMESMALGVPVIATGWSGNVDFMSDGDSMLVDYDLVPVKVDDASPYSAAITGVSAEWAEARVEDAAARMHELRTVPGLRDELSERARIAVGRRIEEVGRARFAEELEGRLGMLDSTDPERRARVAMLRRMERSQRLRYPYYAVAQRVWPTVKRVPLLGSLARGARRFANGLRSDD